MITLQKSIGARRMASSFNMIHICKSGSKIFRARLKSMTVFQHGIYIYPFCHSRYVILFIFDLSLGWLASSSR